MKSLKARSLSFGMCAFAVFMGGMETVFGACALESWLPKELQDYTKALSEALEKISQAASSTHCPPNYLGTTTGNVDLAANSIEAAVNSVLSQETYRAAAAFDIDIAMKAESPKPIQNHLKQLYSANEEIIVTIENLYAQCASEVRVTPGSIFPTGSNEDSKKDTLDSFAKSILQNHTELIHLYKITVLWYPKKDPFHAIVLGKDFSADLKKSYGTTAVEACVKEGESFKDLKGAIEKISKTASSIKNGMTEWQTTDGKTESSQEEEMRNNKNTKLTEVLNKTGLSSNISTNVVRNSWKYNLLDSDNWISGFVQNSWVRLAQTFDNFKANLDFAPKPSTSVSTDQWLSRLKNLQNLGNDLMIEITGQFKQQMDNIGDGQLAKDTYQGKLGDIYIQLEAAQEWLKWMRKISRKICKQDVTKNVDAGGCDPVK